MCATEFVCDLFILLTFSYCGTLTESSSDCFWMIVFAKEKRQLAEQQLFIYFMKMFPQTAVFITHRIAIQFSKIHLHKVWAKLWLTCTYVRVFMVKKLTEISTLCSAGDLATARVLFYWFQMLIWFILTNIHILDFDQSVRMLRQKFHTLDRCFL